MTAITFDKNNNISPPEPISLPSGEIRNILVFNEQRRKLWLAYLGIIDTLHTLLESNEFEVWIDGVFASQMEDPKIITFCICINHQVLDTLSEDRKTILRQFIAQDKPPTAACLSLEEQHACQMQIILKDNNPNSFIQTTLFQPIYEKKKQDFLHDEAGNPKGYFIYNSQKGEEPCKKS